MGQRGCGSRRSVGGSADVASQPRQAASCLHVEPLPSNPCMYALVAAPQIPSCAEGDLGPAAGWERVGARAAPLEVGGEPGGKRAGRSPLLQLMRRNADVGNEQENSAGCV